MREIKKEYSTKLEVNKVSWGGQGQTEVIHKTKTRKFKRKIRGEACRVEECKEDQEVQFRNSPTWE